MKIALIGDEKYENRGELKETIFKLKEKFGEDLTIITRGKKNGVEKWVRKYALEMNLKYIEFNPAHTSRTLYSGMDDEYYDKPYHPTQPLHQYDCIVHNSDKIVYFGEITRKEFKEWKNKFETLNKENFSVRNTGTRCQSYKYKCWLTCKHQERAFLMACDPY